MKTRKLLAICLMMGMTFLVIGAAEVFAVGTATASDTASAGDDCGKISKKRNQTTGGMNVTKVEVNGVVLSSSDYTVTGGGSTQPKITFHTPLAAGDRVTVTLSTDKSGRYEVNLELSKGRC